jgi:hypothetical protein
MESMGANLFGKFLQMRIGTTDPKKYLAECTDIDELLALSDELRDIVIQYAAWNMNREARTIATIKAHRDDPNVDAGIPLWKRKKLRQTLTDLVAEKYGG